MRWLATSRELAPAEPGGPVSRGVGDLLERADKAITSNSVWALAPESGPADVLSTWKQLVALHRQWHSLVKELKDAEMALGRDANTGIYEEPELTVIVSEVLQAITSHRADGQPLALEAGILRVADALDMAEGRSRIPFEKGRVSMHSLSAAAIDDVSIADGESRPVKIEIVMNNSSGIFQVDEVLKAKLTGSGLEPYVEATFETLYADEVDAMARLAFLMVGSETQAEELVHDAFARAIAREALLRGPADRRRVDHEIAGEQLDVWATRAGAHVGTVRPMR